MKINSFWGDLTDISAKRKHWLCGFQPPALHHLPPHNLYHTRNAALWGIVVGGRVFDIAGGPPNM